MNDERRLKHHRKRLPKILVKEKAVKEINTNQYTGRLITDLKTLDQDRNFVMDTNPDMKIYRYKKGSNERIDCGYYKDIYVFYRQDLQQHFWDSDPQDGERFFEGFVTDRTESKDRLSFSFLYNDKSADRKYVNLYLDLQNRGWYDEVFKASIRHLPTPWGTSETILHHVLLHCTFKLLSKDDMRKNYLCMKIVIPTSS